MPLGPEQALDEATHRKVEGAFDCFRIASRQIREEAESIRSEGGEERLAILLDEAADKVMALLKETTAAAYFRPPTDEEKSELDNWKESLPGFAERRNKDEQESLFVEGEEDSLAA